MINRREFLKRTGWTLLGGLLVPYVPKVFYSIPKEIVKPGVVWVNAALNWNVNEGLFPYIARDGSRENPYKTIKEAMEKVAEGGEVLVAPGRFETISSPIECRASMRMYGVFLESEYGLFPLINTNGYPVEIKKSVIKGAIWA